MDGRRQDAPRAGLAILGSGQARARGYIAAREIFRVASNHGNGFGNGGCGVTDPRPEGRGFFPRPRWPENFRAAFRPGFLAENPMSTKDPDEYIIKRLRAENATLRAALEPFAKIKPSSFFSKDGRENEPYSASLTTNKYDVDFTGRDLAAAREALKPKSGSSV